MRPAPEVHDALACLLTYPGQGAGEHYPAAVKVVQQACPETGPSLDAFLAGIAGLEEGPLEELYTRTFDNVAERSLEVGWQLFGENYARGVMLVRLRALMREHGVPERTELPDHLTHVLPLLGRAPEALARSMASGQVSPAVDKIIHGLRDFDSPWLGVLEAAQAVLAGHSVGASALENTKETAR